MGPPLRATAKLPDIVVYALRPRNFWRPLVLAVAGILAFGWLASGVHLRLHLFWTRAQYPDLYEASIDELQHGMTKGLFSAEDLVRTYLARIEEVNHQGPELRAVLEVNPSATEHAKQLDAERARGFLRGPMHGIPVLLKDNIASRFEEGMNTTAGSYALLGSMVRGDATVAAKLREAGAIFLGKAAQDEWSGARGLLPLGWSGRGGQISNAYYPKGSPCGSSGGSGVSAAIGLAAVAIGTETDGSITCPANYNNLAGIKPTVGLTSRKGVIPVSEHQDTVGPLARSLRDATIVLSVIAGRDAADNYTLAQPEKVPDYLAALDRYALQGVRLGVPRKFLMNATLTEWHPSVEIAFQAALRKFEQLGATIIDPADFENAQEIFETLTKPQFVMAADMKLDLEAYLSELVHVPTGVRTIEDLVAFNNNHRELERPPGHEAQSVLENISSAERNSTYYEQLAHLRQLVGKEGIDHTMKQYKLDALVLPAFKFTASVPARVGYPIVTIPMGFYPKHTKPEEDEWGIVYPAPGMPMGISFIGRAFSETKLLGLAYSYEQATQFRLERKAYAAAVPKTQLRDIVGRKWWWIC
ncbi:amidase signature enzyme [Auriculariales sp. MPI-PUGE-AT-0066]|nr:amidase signature enzyme [Auriculariales sp. MPI-PUGE-AT-0066]